MCEGLLWTTAVALGGGIVGFCEFADAREEVVAWLKAPPGGSPSQVLSAPIELRVRDPLTRDGLLRDLTDGGYQQVDELERAGQFAVEDKVVHVWTPSLAGPGFAVAEQKGTVTVAGNRVTATTPAGGLTLLPTTLAWVGDLEARRDPVAIESLSPWVVPAVLAVEDARFLEHPGIDPVGILRALRNNAEQRSLQGGSTITQQLVKNLFLTRDRTLRRKVHEVFLALAFEVQLDKRELAELYLSEVYLGHVDGVPLRGVEQASWAWFGKGSGQLSLAEAATIAGAISSPNGYSPLRDPSRARERRAHALGRMYDVGLVSRAEVAAAQAEPMRVNARQPTADWRAPWVVSAALDEVKRALPESNPGSDGLRIHTTVQPHYQRAAQEAVKQGLAKLERDHRDVHGTQGAQGALVALRHDTGRVRALVGGTGWSRSAFNRAVRAWRHLGSTVKPLTLLAALNHDRTLTPVTIFEDEAISRTSPGGVWRPQNYDGAFRGPTTLRRAIEASRNIPAVLLSERVGRSRLRRFLESVGLSRATALPSASLGAFEVTPLELAGAYTALAQGGMAARPLLVDGVEDASGAVLLDPEPERARVASVTAAALARTLMEGVVQNGTGKRLKEWGIGDQLAGKTGTTDDYRDAWFVGFDPEMVVATWVGRDKGHLGLPGSEGALPTWARFMKAASVPRGRFSDPRDLVRVNICADTWGQPCDHRACSRVFTETFARYHVPAVDCTVPEGEFPDDPDGWEQSWEDWVRDYQPGSASGPEVSAWR